MLITIFFDADEALRLLSRCCLPTQHHNHHQGNKHGGIITAGTIHCTRAAPPPSARPDVCHQQITVCRHHSSHLVVGALQ